MIHHRKKPILYVDDTVEQRYAMRRILETEGYLVHEAGTGREALALLEKRPCLAVVDVRLPDISGYDLTRELKQREPYMPVLQVSASFSDPNLRASGLSGGADAYIAQPVHPSELTALIKRMLQTGEAEESLRFLAGVGLKMSASLSLPVACETICKAMTPHFANHCLLYLKNATDRDKPFWPEDLPAEDSHRKAMIEQAELRSVRLVDSRFLLASLVAGEESLGSLAFLLDEAREYTASDEVLAADLASRAALTLQNCILYSSEQTTRTALIQSEKLATAGRMAAAIAHEVNNPLEALTNLIYLMEHSPEATPFIRETATTALAEVSRMAHITRQTLGFYRELQAPSAMNLSETVTDTVDLYKKRFQTKGLELQLNLAPTVPMRGIKGEILQVVSNLLVNALEAMEAGGHITATTRTDNGKAILWVEDNGPGIPPATLKRIFEPFYTTKGNTGTGLGLWITQNIVEKHEGTITVSSSTSPQDHGTRFVLEFPLVEVPAR